MAPTPDDPSLATLLDEAESHVREFLSALRTSGSISAEDFAEADRSVIPNLRAWLSDPAVDRLSPHLREGVRGAIEAGKWDQIVSAYLRQVAFGTGGIRALMAFDKESITRLRDVGLDAPILKGPNTLNNVVVMKAAHGVARYLIEHPRPGRALPPKVVVGFDSRTRGADYARTVAQVLLAEGAAVLLFDEAVPYPEVTFAIPHLEADLGIFISASHNDYRYNGFKMSGPNGAQISYAERTEILNNYILKLPLSAVRPVDLSAAPPEVLARLVFLGGSEPLPGVEYFGRQGTLRDVHSAHTRHVRSFLLDPGIFQRAGRGAPLRVAYAAFNGSGRRAVPRLLGELGVRDFHSIRSLDPLDGFFPAFDSAPGLEQQPDPGDARAALVALRELARDGVRWADFDLLIGTDPDADRCGVVVRPPESIRAVAAGSGLVRYSDEHMMLPADELWALILWYRLRDEQARARVIRDPAEGFIALSHTTCDLLTRIAQQHGLGVLKTWVGFGWLSAGVAEAWGWEPGQVPRVVAGRVKPEDELCHRIYFDTTGMDARRKINLAAMEQSNGFSILGGPPPGFPQTDYGMGAGGHVRDKDGTLAAVLVAEIAAYAKSQGMTLPDMLAEHVYSDPAIGLFVNYYEPDPMDGEYAGIEGDSKKGRIVKAVLDLHARARAGGLVMHRRTVTRTEVYTTGKYDKPGRARFPDEGVRFYFGSDLDHLTVRPSGTTNSLRFHVQFHGGPVAAGEAWERRLALELEARDLVGWLRREIGAE
jgi:phosphoglucomutase